jgi:hypothetical protein
MRPPLRYNIWDFRAPFPDWTKLNAFATETECRAHYIGPVPPVLSDSARAAIARMHMVFPTIAYSLAEAQSRRCVASNDPRLKEK